ncbi:MAG: trypsin-like peptidase domain-containing protein [Planctomycetales bacterium]
MARQLRLVWMTGLMIVAAECVVSAEEPSGLAAAAAIENAFVKAIESAEKSVVSIARDKVQPPQAAVMNRQRNVGLDRPIGIEDPNYIPSEYGAGIILDERGLILTNYHLVRGGPIEGRADPKGNQVLYVRLPDRRGFEALIYAADPRSDLAVLKLISPDMQPIPNLHPLKLGNASTLRKGQLVLALGNPYLIARDGSASATWGIVSNLTRQAMQDTDLGEMEARRRETIQNLGVLIQVDTRLELGTSGGALLNLQGELIGITTALASIVGYEKSAGFAVPINDSTRRIIESLRQGKEVEYGFLGIIPFDVSAREFSEGLAPLAARWNQHGAARIQKVVEHLPAERGGMMDNDIVFRVGDKPVLSKADLMREIGLLAPGTTARIRVWRHHPNQGGRELELAVEVGKWPAVDEEGIVAPKPLRDPWRGVDYDYPTARLRSFSQPQYGAGSVRNDGVLITDVATDSPAAAAELKTNDVITHVKGKAVHSPREFLELVRGETGPVPLQILPGASARPVSRTVEVKPR